MPKIKYPNGTNPIEQNERNIKRKIATGQKNLGMDLEHDVIKSCDYYEKQLIASIHKRPTPIQVMKIDNNEENIIAKAKFNQKSTTDFVGCYKGHYVDFECKKTTKKTFSFELFAKHQLEHMRRIEKLKGICFVLCYLQYYNKVFLVRSNYITNRYFSNETSPLDIDFFNNYAQEVTIGYTPRLELIDAIEKVFFKK